ncbi:MAG TPA: AzlD domain-containing protein [Chloroflexia bacterium]|nr:AzlD domain-containing protein [Chloroflexia bacterium]
MRVDPIVLATIISMAVVTYATRVAGFALLSRAGLSGRLTAWLAYIPSAVLMAIVAPAALPTGLAAGAGGESGALVGGLPEAVGAAITAAVAVRFKNLLLAMAAGVAIVWLLRRLLGVG